MVSKEETCTEGVCARHYFSTRMKLADVGLQAAASCDTAMPVVADLPMQQPFGGTGHHHRPSLQHLNLDYIRGDISDAGLEAAVTRHCSDLQQLRMCGWHKITAVGLGSII